MALSNIYYSIIISAVNVIGIQASLFIVAVNLLDWAKGRSLNTCDRILLSLGISNTLSQCILVANIFINMKWAEVPHMDYMLLVFIQLDIWLNTSSFFLTAFLCVFYCVKIVDFKHLLFIRLKLRISQVVPWLILLSVVGPMAISFPIYWNVYRDSPENSTVNLIANSTVRGGELKWNEAYILPSMVLSFVVPLLLAMVSITLILMSLYTHTKKMGENALGFSQPRMDAHVGAARVVGPLLLIYFITFLAVVVRLCSNSDLLNLVMWIIIDSSLAVQSMVLVLGNTKMKKALWQFLSLWRQ